MSDLAKRQYLFVLPIPVTPPSHDARLGGIVFVRTDAAFNIIGKKEFLACKMPVHQLTSPAYLFSQGLVPNSCTAAVSEYKFLQRIKELFNQSNLYIVTYGANYLEYIYTICNRVFESSDLLSKCFCVLDIKTAFNTYALLDDLKLLKAKDNLKSRALMLGFNENTDSHDITARLDMLLYCFKTLIRCNPRLVNYLMQGRLSFRASLINAINNNKILVHIDNAHKSLELIKPLAIHDSLLEVMCYKDGAGLIKAVNLNLFELIAPIGILTKERLELLNFDLQKAHNDLVHADKDSAVNAYKAPEYIEYINSLSSTDRAYIKEIGSVNPQSLTQSPAHIDAHLRQAVFLFRAENFLGTLLDQELNLYYRYARETLEKNIGRYYKECRMIAQGLDEKDEDGAKLIEAIMHYPSTL